MKDEEHRNALLLRDRLLALVQLDTDAIRLYDEALKRATDDGVRRAFTQFQAEHRRHVSEMTAAIQHIGWATPEPKVDLKGHLAEWLTAMGRVAGTNGALRAVRTAERYHTKQYGAALHWQIDHEGLAELLRSINDDEVGHLAFVDAHVGKVAIGARR